MTATEPTPMHPDLLAIVVAKEHVLAAAVTWWGDQIVSDDMPDGHERNLAEAVDAYVASLQIQFSDAGLTHTPAGRLLEQLTERPLALRPCRWADCPHDNDTTHITCPNCRSCEDVHDDSDGDELVAAHCDRCGWDTRAEPDERCAP